MRRDMGDMPAVELAPSPAHPASNRRHHEAALFILDALAPVTDEALTGAAQALAERSPSRAPRTAVATPVPLPKETTDMLIHPWDAALDPPSGSSGSLPPTTSACSPSTTSIPRRRRGAAHPLHPGRRRLLCTSPVRTRSGRISRRPARCGSPWWGTGPTSRPTGAPPKAFPPRRACRRATTRAVQFVCRPTVIDDPPEKADVLTAQLADLQPEGRHADVSPDDGPYRRMLSGIRGDPAGRAARGRQVQVRRCEAGRAPRAGQRRRSNNATKAWTRPPPGSSDGGSPRSGSGARPSATHDDRPCPAAAVPPWTLAVAAMLAVQLGSRSRSASSRRSGRRDRLAAAHLGAVFFLLVARPPLRSIARRDLLPLLGLGVTTGLQTVAFLGAIERLPLGTSSRSSSSGP